MAAPFDTLELVKELENAGFDQKQAEGLVHGLAKALSKYDLATKQDLKDLEVALQSDVEKMEVALRSDVEKMEVALRSDMEKMEVALRAEIDGIRKDIDMLKWLMSGLIFGVVLLLINAYWVG